jgi:IBR domain, a half RING-finger domain
MSKYANVSGPMAPPEPEVVAKIDMPYVERNLPLTFFGVKHSRWTKQDIVEIIEALGGHGSITTNRIELYETVHHRYNPNRILQRTITALGTKAQAAAGQSRKLQEQVREAVQAATTERANLARERRAAAKPKRNFTPERHHVYPVQQVAKRVSEPNYDRWQWQPRANTWRRLNNEIKREEDPDGDADLEHDEDHVPGRRKQGRPTRAEKGMDLDGVDYRWNYKEHRKTQLPDPRRGSGHQSKQAKKDEEDATDDQAVGLFQKAILSTSVGRLEADMGRNRKRQAQLAPDTGKAKRRKTDPSPEAAIHRSGPAELVLGTSTAIRDSVASRLGFEATTFAGAAGHPPCQVCNEDWDPLLQFQVSVATGCNHEPEICLRCWEQHIVSETDTKAWDAITCPHYKCGVMLSHEDMQRFAPTDIFRRYDRYKTNQALQGVPGYRRCAHEGCGSGGFVEGEGATYMKCTHCQRHTCLGCNLIQHYGQTCEEYRTWHAGAERAHAKELKRAEEESAQYLSRNAKTCPNGVCGARIQKATGCDHMTCRVCQHEFCWVCLADFNRIRHVGNHWHERKCPYHFPVTTKINGR